MFFARLEDLLSRADRGEIVKSVFLSPSELRISREFLDASGRRGRYLCFGGYSDAERQRIFFLPEYLEDANEYLDIAEYFEEPPIAALKIQGSGYRRFTHRDVLGSLLSLGIERDALGDIVFENEDGVSVVLFCDRVIARFVSEELCRVANDVVKVQEFDVSQDFEPYRNFLHISDTVSSVRIDCVVAALCSLSREKAQAAVLSETVEVDFFAETRPDRQISAPCIISVRGVGRFRVNSVSDKTRKGRFRLDADKYL